MLRKVIIKTQWWIKPIATLLLSNVYCGIYSCFILLTLLNYFTSLTHYPQNIRTFIKRTFDWSSNGQNWPF